MRKALITGGLGFIGSNLANHLAETGEWYFDIVDNMSNGHLEFVKHLPGDKLICDFADDMVLDRVRAQAYDVIFHMAAVPRVGYSVENPAKTTDDNLNKSVALLEACRGNVDRFVFSSSSSVYGNTDVLPTPPWQEKKPRSPYALQKSCVEEFIKMFCELYEMDAISLRYFNVYGKNAFGDSPYATAVSAWCDAIKHDKPLRSDGDGEQSRDLCYVDNVVQANVLATKYTGRFNGDCYNVGCGDQTSNNHILAYFRNRFPGIKVVNAPERKGDVHATCADIRATQRDLGYEPIVKFWEGLERTCDWWKI